MEPDRVTLVCVYASFNTASGSSIPDFFSEGKYSALISALFVAGEFDSFVKVFIVSIAHYYDLMDTLDFQKIPTDAETSPSQPPASLAHHESSVVRSWLENRYDGMQHKDQRILGLYLLDHSGSSFSAPSLLRCCPEITSIVPAQARELLREMAEKIDRMSHFPATLVIGWKKYNGRLELFFSMESRAAILESREKTRALVTETLSPDDQKAKTKQEKEKKERENLAIQAWLIDSGYDFIPTSIPSFGFSSHLQRHLARICLEYLVQHRGQWIDSTELLSLMENTFDTIPKPSGFRTEPIHIRDFMRNVLANPKISVMSPTYGVIADLSMQRFMFNDVAMLRRQRN